MNDLGGYVTAADLPAMQSIRLNHSNGQFSELRFADGILTFNGEADAAARVFLEQLAFRYNIHWNRMKERLERTEKIQHTGKIHSLITELLIADSVPLSDAWKTALDGVGRLEHQKTTTDELDSAKSVRGWRYIDMCMYCGTVATMEEITAAGALSCCPERHMVKTLVPAGYKDPMK